MWFTAARNVDGPALRGVPTKWVESASRAEMISIRFLAVIAVVTLPGSDGEAEKERGIETHEPRRP